MRGGSQSGGVCALRLGQIPKGLLVSPAVTRTADGFSSIINIYLCSQSSVVCFGELGKTDEIASCLKIQLPIV